MQRTCEVGSTARPDGVTSAKPSQRFGEIGHVPDWARIRLELAVDDATHGRLDGVLGHCLALRHLARGDAGHTVCAGLRDLGRAFDAVDEGRLGALARETAALVETQLADLAGGDGTPTVVYGDATARARVVEPAST